MWDLFHTGNAGNVSYIYIYDGHTNRIFQTIWTILLLSLYTQLVHPCCKYDFTYERGLKIITECDALWPTRSVTQVEKRSCFTWPVSLNRNSYTSNFLHSEPLQENVFAETVINCKILGRIVIQIYATQYLSICIFRFKEEH